MARFASGDDQPREAMSWIGRWQTRRVSGVGRRQSRDRRRVRGDCGGTAPKIS